MPRPNVPEDAALIDEAAGSSRLLLPGTMDGPYAYVCPRLFDRCALVSRG